ncbi:hypothetical protein LJR074_003677 [Acidovorax sp. LjRoot74]|uniref:hypothetical protein n=1 Tax=Acidovorax sp. LjRoot74 TaxID=3342337 RepID=UPI003ECC69D1
MATTPPKLVRALVDFYQGGTKVYAAGNLYPESDALLLMKARGEAEVPKVAPESKAAKAAREAQEKADREAQEAADEAAREAQEKAEREAAEAADAATKAAAEQAAAATGAGSAETPKT